MLEAHFENILARYPDLIEPGLRLLGRQETLRGKRADLIFEDANKQRLVIEVKIGAVGRADLGQVAEYCHYLYILSGSRPRGMLVGTRIPYEVLGAAQYLGLECKGISLRDLHEAMNELGDEEMLALIRLPFSSTNDKRAGKATTILPDLIIDPGPVRAVPPHLASRGTEAQSAPADQARTRHNNNPGESTIDAKYRIAFAETTHGKLLKRDEIWALMETRFSGQITAGGILPQDRCYNITNAGLASNRSFRIFEYVERSTFRYLGENYPYNGTVKWKGIQCGQWDNGALTKFDNWPQLKSGRR